MSIAKGKDLIKLAVALFHKMQEVDLEEVNFREIRQEAEEIYERFKPQLGGLLTDEDFLLAFSMDLFYMLGKPFREATDEEFEECFRLIVLTERNYEFYIPIYGLYDFPNLRLGITTATHLLDLPKEVQDDFVGLWKESYSINKEYAKTEDEYVSRKKDSTFLFLAVRANGNDKALEKARTIAEDSLHIIRFLYQTSYEGNFNIVDVRCRLDGVLIGGMERIASVPFERMESCIKCTHYRKFVEERVPILTEIFVKPNANEIERKIRNSVRIFGIQTTVPNQQVRFILLVTCLESLLMTGSDRDYILWRLAEKAAFLLSGDKKKVNDFIKKAYEKRSAFVHGSSDGRSQVTQKDIDEIQEVVVSLVWKLYFDFILRGYPTIQKKKDTKSVDEFIETTKFRS